MPSPMPAPLESCPHHCRAPRELDDDGGPQKSSQQRNGKVGVEHCPRPPLEDNEVTGRIHMPKRPADAPTTQPQTLQQMHGLMIGLSSDDDWQTNFFDDQVWVRTSNDGTFSIANVLPGTYTLHVYCDGQIGEASVAGVRLDAGRKFDLGKVVWTPQSYGLFVWQLGYPDRSTAEFRHGDDATRWGRWALEQKEFPAGVNYLVGKADPQKDWNYAQFPGTTWAIHFPLGFVPQEGWGFLDVALAGGTPRPI